MAAYVPDAGDFIWLTFNPQSGREQAGRRPGLVLSPRSYNQRSALAIVCPITKQAKGYPFEVVIRGSVGVDGVILADQIRSLDWTARRAERLGRCSPEILDEVLARLRALLGF
ncbi:MAG: endoribonuclease MazF [Bryobacteraceae bacterium]